MLTSRILPIGFIASLWLVEVGAGPCKPRSSTAVSITSSEIQSISETETASATTTLETSTSETSVTTTTTLESSADGTSVTVVTTLENSATEASISVVETSATETFATVTTTLESSVTESIVTESTATTFEEETSSQTTIETLTTATSAQTTDEASTTTAESTESTAEPSAATTTTTGSICVSTNLIKNPGFDSPLDGSPWVKNGPTSFSTTFSHSFPSHVYFRAPGDMDIGPIQQNIPELQPDQAYTFSYFWTQGASFDGTGDCFIRVKAGAILNIFSVQYEEDIAYAEHRFNVPAGTITSTTIDIDAACYNAQGPQDIYLDDVYMAPVCPEDG